MTPLFRNIRFYILLSTLAIAAGVYLIIHASIDDGRLQTITLTRTYALLALAYLYVTLLIGPLTYTFPRFPFRGRIFFARRAIGVSVYIFALLHAVNAFFRQLGGFAGLPFLPWRYLIAISLSATALLILFFMTLTSFDAIKRAWGPRRWKFLHRFVYFAGILILIHALMLGTHFQDFSRFIPQFFFAALVFLLLLEARRIDFHLYRRWPSFPTMGLTVGILFGIVLAILLYIFIPHEFIQSFGVHGGHRLP